MISELAAYALANYEAGGHWVYECYDSGDYQDVLDQVGGKVAAAKAELKKRWLLTAAQERECALGEY